MKKSIYEEAVETLNKYHNQNYNSTNKDELLKLYQRLYKDFDDLTIDEQLEIEKQIKELENDN